MKDSIFRIYAGTLGSYKSYHGVLDMIDTLVNGGIVFTNIELVWVRLKIYIEDKYRVVLDDNQLVYINFEQAYDFASYLTKGTFERPNRLVLDEAAITQNAQDHKKANELSRDMIRHARKLHIDTIFIAHDFYEIDKQMRNKAQSVTWHRDMQKVKFCGFSLPFPFWVTVEVDARNPKLKYDSGAHRKDKAIYPLYKSHDVQSAAAHAIGDSPDIKIQRLAKPRPKWIRPVKRIAAFTLFASIGWAFSAAGKNHEEKPEKIELTQNAENEAPEKEQVTKEQTAVVQDEPNHEEKPEKTFVRGYLTMGKRITVILTDGRVLTESSSSLRALWRHGALVDGQFVPLIQPERRTVAPNAKPFPQATAPTFSPAPVSSPSQQKPTGATNPPRPKLYRAFGGLEESS